MKFILQLITLFTFLAFHTAAQETEIKKLSSTENIVRLKPSEFKPSLHCPIMPKSIVNYLEKQNCTIPQSYSIENHHNAFQGEFVKTGQFDWAVLCSRNNTSSIFMFWSSSVKNVSEFASYPDKKFMKAVDAYGSTGFFRTIGKDKLTKLSKTDEILFGNIFPKMDYWGIDELLPDRKSIIYYVYEKKLLVLENTIASSFQ